MSGAGVQRRVAGAWRVARREPAPALRVTTDRLGAAPSARLAAAVSEALERVRPPGAQIAVRRRGTLLWAACAGRSDRTAPVLPEDRFVLASSSTSKTTRWRRASTAALPTIRGRGEVIAAIARLGSERAPGKRFRYCNSNSVVAAELAERASGQDYETLLQTQIAGPLGLPGFSCTRSVPGTRLATPHLELLRRPVDLLAVTGGRIPNDALGPVWGDGGIASSALDLARFTEALFGGELVSARTLRALTARTSRFGRKAGYGLGVMTTRVPGAIVAGHDGVYLGWTASTGVDDATATTVSAVANLAAPSVPAARLAKATREAL